MAITKEDLQEALRKAANFKDELLGKNEDEAVKILTEKAGIRKEIADKAAKTLKSIDLSKVDLKNIDLSKIDLPDIDLPDGIKNIFKK